MNNVQLRMQRLWNGGRSSARSEKKFRVQPVCLFGHHAKFIFPSFLFYIFVFGLFFIKRVTKLVALAS